MSMNNSITKAVSDFTAFVKSTSSVGSVDKLQTLLANFVNAADCPERCARLYVVRCSSFVEDCNTHDISIKVPPEGYCESRWNFNECPIDTIRLCIEQDPDTVEEEPENTYFDLDLNRGTA